VISTTLILNFFSRPIGIKRSRSTSCDNSDRSKVHVFHLEQTCRNLIEGELDTVKDGIIKVIIDGAKITKIVFFAKSTFFHAGQRKKTSFIHAEITFFHAGITFFLAGGCSVKKSNSSVKKCNFSVKKSTFFTLELLFFTLKKKLDLEFPRWRGA
jgi:hypothetical protein